MADVGARVWRRRNGDRVARLRSVRACRAAHVRWCSNFRRWPSRFTEPGDVDERLQAQLPRDSAGASPGEGRLIPAASNARRLRRTSAPDKARVEPSPSRPRPRLHSREHARTCAQSQRACGSCLVDMPGGADGAQRRCFGVGVQCVETSGSTASFGTGARRTPSVQARMQPLRQRQGLFPGAACSRDHRVAAASLDRAWRGCSELARRHEPRRDELTRIDRAAELPCRTTCGGTKRASRKATLWNGDATGSVRFSCN